MGWKIKRKSICVLEQWWMVPRLKVISQKKPKKTLEINSDMIVSKKENTVTAYLTAPFEVLPQQKWSRFIFKPIHTEKRAFVPPNRLCTWFVCFIWPSFVLFFNDSAAFQKLIAFFKVRISCKLSEIGQNVHGNMESKIKLKIKQSKYILPCPFWWIFIALCLH